MRASEATSGERDGRVAEAAGRLGLILAGHGDRGAGLTNGNLIAHSAALADRGLFGAMQFGVLKGEPTLETALLSASQAGVERVAIFPFFMADGYFASKILPERIAAASLDKPYFILPPLGLDRRLARLILDDASARMTAAGMPPESARLLIVGHGSKFGPASADATRALAANVAALGNFAIVETAFLEEAPFLDEALAARPETHTVVSGFFSGDGMHAGEDVPGAIAETRANAVYAGPIGAHPGVGKLILGSVLDWIEAEIAGERAPR